MGIEKSDAGGFQKWCFGSEDWEAFRLLTNQELDEINWNTEVDHLNFTML